MSTRVPGSLLVGGALLAVLGIGVGAGLALLVGDAPHSLAVVIAARARRTNALIERCVDLARCIPALAATTRDRTLCGALSHYAARETCWARVPGAGGRIAACAAAPASERNRCLSQAALEMGDVDVCLQIGTEGGAARCAAAVAADTLNPDDCPSPQADPECLAEMAKALKRPELCLKLGDRRDSCLSHMRWGRPPTGLCELCKDCARANCLFSEASTEPLACEALEPQLQGECYQHVFGYSRGHPPTLCAGIANPRLADRCYARVGACALVGVKSDREECIARVASDPKQCFTLSLPELRAQCAERAMHSALATLDLCQLLPPNRQSTCSAAVRVVHGR